MDRNWSFLPPSLPLPPPSLPSWRCPGVLPNANGRRREARRFFRGPQGPALRSWGRGRSFGSVKQTSGVGWGSGHSWTTHSAMPFLTPPPEVAFLFIFVGLFSVLMVFFLHLEDYLCFINRPPEHPLLHFLSWAGSRSPQAEGGAVPRVPASKEPGQARQETRRPPCGRGMRRDPHPTLNTS